MAKKPKDKRTKEYKEWVKAQKEAETVGVGDVVEKVTKVTGIKQIVDSVFDKSGKDCGCDKRKEKWNKLRLQWKPINCFTETQYNWWTNFIKSKPTEVNNEEREMIRQITITLFGRDIKKPSCCYKQHIDRINKLYDKYQ